MSEPGLLARLATGSGATCCGGRTSALDRRHTDCNGSRFAMAGRTAAHRPTGSLASIKREAAGCRRCPLWRHATQVVFGEGPARAQVMLVGEQPGDVEDLKGAPFVGPAGLLLREVLEEVGLTAKQPYLTNAVKHFKWTPRGKRRIHERPNRDEILACRMWLEEEIAHVRPR